jgi:hypothetical protein
MGYTWWLGVKEPVMVGAWMLAALSDTLRSLLPLLGVVLILLSLFFSMRKRRQKRRTEPTAREQLERTNQRQGMRDDLQTLMVEIEQMAKRLSSQIDTKAARLEKLLDQADQRIAELERARGEAGESPRAGGERLHGGSQTDAGGQRGDEPSLNDASTADGPRRSVEEVEKAASVAAAPAGSAARSTPGAQDDPLTRSVYELADAGKAAPQIASELNEHTGKVELILALRRT